MSVPDETLWAALPVPALILDAQNCIDQMNPAAEAFLRSSARATIGQPVWDRLAVDAPLEQAMARARKDEASIFVNDVDVATGDRAPVQCNLQIAPLPGQAGAMLLLISPRELAGRMTQGQSVRSAARSAIGMAEMLAHEIKNPLAGITGAAQLLSMNLTPEDQELTDLIVSESRRIVSLLDQVEQFGNVSAPQLKAINIHDVLDRARRSAVLGFAAEMTVREDYDPSLPLALGDSDQLQQVILNLIKNAAEAAGPEGGTITLRSYYDAGLRIQNGEEGGKGLPLQVEVMDDGPGLPPEIAEQVFEPFVSGRENGTGLGLALAAKVISDHHGWISVSSVPGRTLFRISLPLAPDNPSKEGPS